MTGDNCCIRSCKGEVSLTYLGRPYCEYHYGMICKHIDTREIARAKEDEHGRDAEQQD